MKDAKSSLYQYEGNEGHSLNNVNIEGGSLVCTHCGACVCDHRPVSLEDMPVYNLRWNALITIRLPLSAAHGTESGCKASPETDLFVTATLVNTVE